MLSKCQRFRGSNTHCIKDHKRLSNLAIIPQCQLSVFRSVICGKRDCCDTSFTHQMHDGGNGDRSKLCALCRKRRAALWSVWSGWGAPGPPLLPGPHTPYTGSSHCQSATLFPTHPCSAFFRLNLSDKRQQLVFSSCW